MKIVPPLFVLFLLPVLLIGQNRSKEKLLKLTENFKDDTAKATVLQKELMLNQNLNLKNNQLQQKTKLEEWGLSLLLILMMTCVALLISCYLKYKKLQIRNKKIVKQTDKLQLLNLEVHHRVKNNLQLIISLLRLQANTKNDKAIVEVLSVTENRLQAFAQLHEQLYNTNNISVVVLKDYLNGLLELLTNQFQGSEANINYLLTDSTNLRIDLDAAIPIGLIVNELVTNAITHAFPTRQNIEIQLLIEKTNNKQYKLTVKDNGVGIPEGKLPENSNRLGLKMVKLFAEQLQGSIDYQYEDGSKFVITFQV